MRILIKLSGESLRGGKTDHSSYDKSVLEHIANEIKTLQGAGHHIALVVGGGNLFRGEELHGEIGIERATGDYIGMLSTAQNALVLRDVFEQHEIETRVSSAITMSQICESYMPRRVQRHLEKGRIVIFAAGLGSPYFTTDSTAVQRALEMKSELLIMAKNGVDGVMTADPDSDPDATLIPHIHASDILTRNLKVADQSAIALAREHGLRIKVVNMLSISRALETNVGTTIDPI